MEILFCAESSSKVARSTTEASVDRARIDKISDQGKKLKLIATGEFHVILGGGNDDFSLRVVANLAFRLISRWISPLW